jgi:hypothetical protein
MADLEQDHPEVYSSFKKVETLPLEPTQAEIDSKAVAVIGFGQIEFESKSLPGSFIECFVMTLGDTWNAGSTLEGRGQILAISGQGHVPVSGHEELSSKCRGVGGKAWVTDETPLEKVGKTTVCTTEGKKLSECPGVEEREVLYKEFRRESEQTTPWNVELECDAVEEEPPESYLKVGIADRNSKHANFGEENKSYCPEASERLAGESGERKATEAEQTTQEAEGKHGAALELRSCYAKAGIPGDTPAGCIRFDIVAPAEGFEDAFGGGPLFLRVRNGIAVASPSEVRQMERQWGELQCESEGCTAFGVATGSVKVMGTSLQLIQAH